MNVSLKRLWLILSATVLVISACEKESLRAIPEPEGVFNIEDYDFVIDARNSADPDTKLNASTATWENGDQIYISLDGDDANVYMLKYDSSLDQWGIYNIPGASNMGFATSGTLTALYCSNPSLKMTAGKLQGTTLGDVVYTKTGSYTKAGRVITVSITLDQRPVSILKVVGAGGAAYAENMTNNHTTLTSLNDMTWDSEKSQASYVYDSANDVCYIYGDLPAGGTVRLRYATGDRQVFTRTYAGKSLATGKMATLQGPASSEAGSWTEDMSEYYETGDVIVYNRPRDVKPYTIVVLGDGYTVYDLRSGGAFETAARNAMDYLFSIEPYNKMRDLFNVYFICARSDERGSTIKSTSQNRITYFGVSWTSGTSYTDLDVQNPALMKNFVKAHCPDYIEGLTDLTKTAILILLNENTYAGLCRSETDGQTYCLLPAITRKLAWANAAGVTPTTQGSYLNLVAHEFGGHAIGRLGDEYFHKDDGEYSPGLFSNYLKEQHNWSVPFSRNMTYDNEDYEWSWMPGEGYTNEGLYEGGYASYKTGVWRPEIISCMFDNRPYFNAWSRYLIMERVYSVCGETFNRSVFLAADSGRSRYDEPETKSSWNGVEEAPEFVEMLPPPVITEAEN